MFFYLIYLLSLCWYSAFCLCSDTKNAADHDESPPRTPTGNAPSSESDIDISSPNMSHDESIAKDMSMKDSGSDLSHRPKRRRFHESYNFNMKCPTPGCNSLGTVEAALLHELKLLQALAIVFSHSMASFAYYPP